MDERGDVSIKSTVESICSSQGRNPQPHNRWENRKSYI